MKKRRVWASSPVFYILAGLLFLAAAISWFQDNKILFCAELAAAVLAVASVALATGHFRAYVASALKGAKSVLGAEEYERLKNFTMPVAIVGEAGDIVWVNDAFLASVSPGRECRKVHLPQNLPADSGGRRHRHFGGGAAVHRICE